MKTIGLLFFIVITTNLWSQTTDLLFIPNTNSLLVTYHNRSNVGIYASGYYVTSFPHPYIYTTPFSIINRFGVTISDYNHSISLMGGVFYGTENHGLVYKPDFWIKINPIRLFTSRKTIADFSLGLNYMNGFRYAGGISLSYNIY